MPKIKLLSDYRHLKAGEVCEQHDGKAKELVNLKRAEYVTEEKKEYKNKMMTSNVLVCPKCDKQYKSKAYYKKHIDKCN